MIILFNNYNPYLICKFNNMESSALPQRFRNLLFCNRNDIAVILNYGLYNVIDYEGNKKFFKGQFTESPLRMWTSKSEKVPDMERFYLNMERCVLEDLFVLYEIKNGMIIIYTDELDAKLIIYSPPDEPNVFQIHFQGRLTISLEEGFAPEVNFLDSFRINYSQLKNFPEYDPLTKEFSFPKSGDKTKTTR